MPLSSSLLLALLPALLPPPQAAAPPPPPGARRVLLAPWGSAPGAFGKEDDGARLGPSSLAAAGGKIYILDRIQGRVQVFDLKGRLLEILPVGSRTADLLAPDGKGRVLVLDAFVKKEVRILSRGAPPRILPLPPPPRPGLLPSGIFAGKETVLIEWGHALVTALPAPGVVPLFPSALLPPPGGVLPGRPWKAGWIQAARTARGLALVFGRKEGRVPQEVEYPVQGGVECILDLLSDREGRVAAALFPWGDPERRILVRIFSPRGRILAERLLPGGSVTDLLGRFFLSPEGRLFQLRTSDRGVEVLEWDWTRWRKPSAPSPARKAGRKEAGS